MSVPAIFFKGLLKTLAGQFIDQKQDHAECIGDDFGTHINQNTLFFALFPLPNRRETLNA